MSINQWKSIFEEMGVITGMSSCRLDDDGNCSIVNAHPLCPIIHIYYDAQSDSVAVFSEVGFIGEDRETELMRDVLRENYLNKSGPNYAIGPTGALIAQMFFNVIELTPQELATSLNRFTVELMKTRKKLFMKTKKIEEPSDVSPENAIMI